MRTTILAVAIVFAAGFSGAILEAHQSMIRTEAEQEAARLEIPGELARSHTTALSAYQRVQTPKSAVAPVANRALSAALDAQRTRFKVEERLAAALGTIASPVMI